MATLSLPRTVKEQLADHLRDEIVRGTFEPGERLRLEDIASRFEVSTMPVREALRDLESEGLVTIYPHRGAVVTELTAEEMEDIYDIRATLEAMATRLAVPRMTESICEELAISWIRWMDNWAMSPPWSSSITSSTLPSTLHQAAGICAT